VKENDGSQKWSAKWRERLGLTADVLQLATWIGLPTVVALVGFLLTGGGQSNQSAPPSPSATTTTNAPSTVSSTTPSSGQPVSTALLSDLPSASGKSSDLRFQDVDIDGRHYENSLRYSCELFCDGPSPATYDVDLGRRYSRFTAVAGVVDTAASGSTDKFEIDVDGALQSWTASIGHPQTIDIDVHNALRLSIRIYPPATLRSPLQAGADAAGGTSSVLPDAALGHPVLIP
jgi:hypothetical protein